MTPLLLLVPGMLNTAGVWREVAALLRDDADVRIADVQSQSTIAEMARDAWACVGDVPRDTPLALCGFSMGGYVAMQMLAEPARGIDAVALLGTMARIDSDAAIARRKATAAAMERDFAGVVDDIARAATHPITQQTPALMAQLREVMMGIGCEAGVRQMQAIIGRADHRAELARLDMPVLVACGRDDRITPPDASRELAALIPGARREWIEQAGHMAPLEQPQRVADLLRSTLHEAVQRAGRQPATTL